MKRRYPIIRRGIVRRKAVGYVHAVNGVSIAIAHGETLALVGESGCGKSTLAKMIIGFERPDEGKIFFEGKDVHETLKSDDKKEVLELKRSIQLVFQDPIASLDPTMTIHDTLAEPLIVHRWSTPGRREERVIELLNLVGLERSLAFRYPSQLSGGQKQRVAIARALSLSPKFVVLDEPVSSLDVSVRAKILNLLAALQKKENFTYLYISHDLSSVRNISNRVAVMYLGRIVELAATEELFRNPIHPYTRALLSAVPVPDPEFKPNRILLEGEVPDSVNLPAGCNFNPRCAYARGRCRSEEQELVEVTAHHFVACWVMKETFTAGSGQELTPSAAFTR